MAAPNIAARNAPTIPPRKRSGTQTAKCQIAIPIITHTRTLTLASPSPVLLALPARLGLRLLLRLLARGARAGGAGYRRGLLGGGSVRALRSVRDVLSVRAVAWLRRLARETLAGRRLARRRLSGQPPTRKRRGGRGLRLGRGLRRRLRLRGRWLRGRRMHGTPRGRLRGRTGLSALAPLPARTRT